MTTINGVGGAIPTTAPALMAGAGFDGETLMLYCQSQLNDLNSQIKAHMAQQRETRDQKQLLNELTGLMSKYAQGGINPGDRGARYDILKKFAEVISKLPPGPNKDALMTQFNHFRSTACHRNGPASPVRLDSPEDVRNYVGTQGQGLDADLDACEWTQSGVDLAAQPNTMTADEVTTQLKALQSVGDEIGANSELAMINLQQLISNRQMAIQMTTNAMNKFLQGLEAITANVGK